MSAPQGIFLGRLSTPTLSNLPPVGELYFYTDSADNSFKQIESDGTVTDLDGGVRVYTKQQNFGTVTLTDAASIAWNLDDEQVAKVTLTDNRTLANPTNMVDGGTYVLRVIQDGTGSQTLAYGSAYKWMNNVAPTLTTTAAGIDLITFVSDGTNMFGTAQLDFS